MTIRSLIIPAYLFLCVLLGGASAAGFMANLVLQLVAIPILAVSLLTRRRTPMPLAARHLLILAGVMVAMVALTLVPLPPSIWSSLPGREGVVAGYELLDQELPWLPVSLDPDETIAALLWLLPALAVLLGIIRWGAFEATWIAWSLIGATLLATIVGAFQVASGGNSPAYFYAVTNRGFAVGFFANNNHMATLLLIAIPFIVALHEKGLKGRSRSFRRNSATSVLTVSILLVIVVGLAINTSLAGIGLAVPVALATLLLRRRSQRVPASAMAGVGALSLACVIAVFYLPLGNNLFGADARGSESSRYTSITRTVDLAVEHAPLGTGVGTFAEIYRTREDPNLVTRTYMNHAHSDFAEVALEASIPGLMLVLAFLLWWGRRTVLLWQVQEKPDLMARAATIASAAVILHSLVDYPLRTAAISAIFAALVALMAQPRPKLSAAPASESDARHLSA